MTRNATQIGRESLEVNSVIKTTQCTILSKKYIYNIIFFFCFHFVRFVDFHKANDDEQHKNENWELN